LEIQKQYRPEIEGLRVIASFLVAIYHIWFMKVSGGVDVFFVVSGFLITTSLLSKYARDGYIKFSTYVLGLMKRLLPNALIVLIFVVIVGYFILPEARHGETIREIIASLFYVENWQLAVTGTDYLAQDNEQSPVQHFWAMSIQGQFYIIWFLIISATIFLNNKFKTDFKKLFMAILTILFTVSFFYSIYLTTVNQPWAYFDTRTRIWEFAIGGILMLFIFKVKLPQSVSFITGWIGFAGLISTGIILDVETSFPGYVALWPVASAVLIMLAGQNPSNFGVEKMLGSKPMVKLGGLSYGLYLWHWPLLIFYYIIFDTQSVSFLHGLILIILSLLMSYITTMIAEKPIGEFIYRRKYSLKSFTPIFALLGVMVISLTLWLSYNQVQSSLADQLSGDPNYPGALANTEEFEGYEEMDPIPDLGSVKDDQSEPYNDGCHVPPDESEVEICEYGEKNNYNYTIALVGGSKSTHWLPSLQSFSEDESIRILNVTKSGCQFSYNPDEDTGDCFDWNEDVIGEVSQENPDLVVTLADNGHADEEEVPEGYINQFNRLGEEGIEVMAIRDTPYFEEDVAECLSQHGVDTNECDADRNQTVPTDSAWDKLENPPSNVHYVDYTQYICDDETCPPVIGNIIAYMDGSHMTTTFNETFGPLVRENMMDILDKSSDGTSEDDKSQNEENTQNLFDKNSLEEGVWINYEGGLSEEDDMVITESIPYDSDNEYILTMGAYVSYYNGDEFIKTSLVTESTAEAIESVDEADNIRLSFNREHLEEINLTIE